MFGFMLNLLLLASGLVEVRSFTFSTIAWALALQGVLKVNGPTVKVGLVTKVTEINRPKVKASVGFDFSKGAALQVQLPSSFFPLWKEELVGNFHQVDLWINKGKWLKLTTLFTSEGVNKVVSIRVDKGNAFIFFHHDVGEKPRVKHLNFRLKRKLVCCHPQDLSKALRKRHLFPDGVGPVYVQIRYYGFGYHKVTLRCDHPND